MDIAFIREVMNEQVRLNVALCQAAHETANIVREKDMELTKARNDAAKSLREKDEELMLERKERDDACRECEEWKHKYEELRVKQVEGESFLRDELRKIREEVEQHGAIPYDIVNEEKEEVVEEEKNVVIDDKKEKRREYMKEYMKKKRDAKKSNEDTE